MPFISRHTTQDFYPRPPRGGRPRPAASPASRTHFYPRPPRGGRPIRSMVASLPTIISIHALREEGDTHTKAKGGTRHDFYPRPPRGGRLLCSRDRQHSVDISIHALREEGDSCRCRAERRKQISIHALREEGDVRVGDRLNMDGLISIHALREEGDRDLDVHDFVVGRFLSTPSARRATALPPIPSAAA